MENTDNNEEYIDEDAIFVAEKLDIELAEILTSKIAKTNGMKDLINDILLLRMRPDGGIMPTKKALIMILKTAKEVIRINDLAKEEYNIVTK